MLRVFLRSLRLALGRAALCTVLSGAPLWAQEPTGSVSVTPDGGTTPDRPANTGGYTANFTVTNTGSAPDSFWISCGWSAPVTCTRVSDDFVTLSAGAWIGISAFYNVGAGGTGEISVSAFSEGSMATDEGYYVVPVVGPPPSNWDVTPFNHEHQVMGRCAAGCFAVTHAQSTVPYFSLDTPRNLTLVYHGDRVHPKPFIHLNVQKPDAQVPQQVWLEVKRGGAYQTFANGETRLKFLAASSGYQRIGGQLRDSTLVTGVHDVDVIVTWYYGGPFTVQTWVSRLLVVNETDAPIARGWTLAGVQRLYPQANGHALITEGDGSAVFFKTGFVSPTGEFSMLETFGAGWRRRYPDSTKVVFNSLGLMTDVYDSFNNRTQFFYDGSNRLTTVRDPNGKDLVLAYGPNGLSSIRDNVTPNRYTTVTVQPSPARTLTAITDPDNVSTGFGYDGSRRLSSVTDRRGQTSTIAWQTVNGKVTGKLASVTAPQIPVFENGQVQSAMPVTSFAPWQTVGVPYVLTGSAPAPVVLPVDVRGQITDPNGHASWFTVNRWGQPVTTTNALGQTSMVTYDGKGLATAMVGATGAKDSVVYNAKGLPTEVLPAGLSTIKVAYHATWVTQPDSVWGNGRPRQRFWIGTGGRVDSVQLGQASSLTKTRYLYNTRGRVTEVKDANGDVVAWTIYGATNDNTWRANTGQVTHEYGYDGYGRVTSDSVLAIGKTTTEYDVLNRTRKVWDPVNANPTEFVYDNLRMIRLIDPKLEDYEFGQNALGWTMWKEDPAGKRDSLWYDRDGGLVRWKTRRGHLVESQYDVLHRLVKKWGTGTTIDTITYFTAGSPTVPSWVKTSNPNMTETVYLNSTTGLAERAQVVLGGRTYDIYAQYLTGALGAGQLDTVWAVGPPGTSFMGRRYLWNTATNGMLATLRLDGKDATMAYDTKQRPISTTFFGGDVTNRDFITSDPMARVEPNQAPLASLARRLEYGFGRVYSQFEMTGPADLGHIFGYDKLGRLQKDTAAMVAHDECWWDPGFGWRCPNPTADSVVTYTYDPVGNVLRDSVYRVWNGTTAVQTGTYGTGNRIQSFGGCTYTTEVDGLVTQRTCGATVTDFWWSSEGRLDSLRHAGTMIRHAYDGSGRLVRRQVGSTTRYFLWHGDHVFAELDANGIELVEYSYYPGMDRPHAIGIADSVYFHHMDGLGNVIGLVKHDQALRAQYDYVHWGDGWSSEDLSGQTNRARFKGALRFGEETELYYMRNRWYEPHTGRFLSEDPIGGASNRYVFAGNDPVNNADPTGLWCEEGWVTLTHDGKSLTTWGLHCEDIQPGDWEEIRDYLGGGGGAGDAFYARARGWRNSGIGFQATCGRFSIAQCGELLSLLRQLSNHRDQQCSSLGDAGLRRFAAGRYRPMAGGGGWAAKFAPLNVWRIVRIGVNEFGRSGNTLLEIVAHEERHMQNPFAGAWFGLNPWAHDNGTDSVYQRGRYCAYGSNLTP